MTEPERFDRKDATAVTREALARAGQALPPAGAAVEEDARRGFVGALEPPVIMHRLGFPLVDLSTLDFVDGPLPDTVHPSLWENARLGHAHGLFRVADRVHQVRGYDVANVTVIEGDTGYVFIDSLTCVETAEAALGLVREHLGNRPVTGVIITHSHADHYGGLSALLGAEDLAAGRQVLVAPAGFREEVVSENVHLGNAMIRRGSYMFGALLPRDSQGYVSAGIGSFIAAGTASLLTPTHTIDRTGEELVVDGVRVVFQVTPGTEAPAEMNFHFPHLRTLCIAENASQTLHNVHTPRGAQVRDARAWVRYLHEAAELFGDESDQLVACHHWPVWGTEAVRAHLEHQADLYQYVHDESVRLANHGYSLDEVAERIELPPDLAAYWANREHYGTVKHNARAVYQHYLGAFDGHPASLDPHEPAQAARRYVEYMGGADAIVERARASYAEGDYRWVAEVLRHVVLVDPTHMEARTLQADAMEQLGYQSVSAVWRNFYLSGASELRHGKIDAPSPPLLGPDVVAGLSAAMVLEHLAIRVEGPRAATLAGTIHLLLVDRDEEWTLVLRHGVLIRQEGRRGHAGAVVRTTMPGLVALTFGDQYAEQAPAPQVEGDAPLWDGLIGALDRFTFWFPVVTSPDAPLPPPA